MGASKSSSEDSEGIILTSREGTELSGDDKDERKIEVPMHKAGSHWLHWPLLQ